MCRLVAIVWLTIVGSVVHCDSIWLIARVPLSIHVPSCRNRLPRIWVLIVHLIKSIMKADSAT